eukprot:TRINITY_DN22789_c0_g1_i1.p1 TRINITY_DN22789_c0_g1~~TRINITY_DN22789_c0_g1_i1.p1  ORF type:complete len:155 (-),score=25.30 TRINITY_DN22789_c0_g1_i1:99-563(-)
MACSSHVNDNSQDGSGRDFFANTFNMASEATETTSPATSPRQHGSAASSNNEEEAQNSDLPPPLMESAGAWRRQASGESAVSVTSGYQLSEEHLATTTRELRGMSSMLNAVHVAPPPEVRTETLIVSTVLELRDIAALLEGARRGLDFESRSGH